jgi:hypothetical protein
VILLDPEKDAELCKALALWPYVIPTRGKRYALAKALYAAWSERLGEPGAQAMRRACFARIRVLTNPGEFDADAYDEAAGFPYAFSIDWRTHELAQTLYRRQAAP